MCFILYPGHCPVVYSCKFACMWHAYGCGFPFLCCLINVFLSLETDEIASLFDLGCNLYDIELHRWLVSACSLTWKFVIRYQRYLCPRILCCFGHHFWFSTSLYCRHTNWFTMLMSFSYNLWLILCRSNRVTGRKLEMSVFTFVFIKWKDKTGHCHMRQPKLDWFLAFANTI